MRILFTFCVCVLFLLKAGSAQERPGTNQGQVGRLAEAIPTATGYLRRHCAADGRFAYRRFPNEPTKKDKKYNLLRHAGTLYSLAMAYRRQPEPETLAVLRRAAGFLHRRIGPLSGKPDRLAVWTLPLDVQSGTFGDPAEAKLGGAGLGLIALAQLRGIQPKAVPLPLLQGLGRFILFMQQEDGGFRSKYIEEQGVGRFHSWASLYYPGEAMLGLVLLYQIDGNRVWLDAAFKGLLYLAETRKDLAAPPADHWLLLATAAAWPYRDKAERPGSVDEPLLRHVRQICTVMLGEQRVTPEPVVLRGSFLRDGRTCPCAIRLEGLLAALQVLPEKTDDALRKNIETAVSLGIDFLLRQQMVGGAFDGGMPRAAAEGAALAGSKAAERRAGEIRIDYVQHAMSAMIEQERRCEPEREANPSFAVTVAGAKQIAERLRTVASENGTGPAGDQKTQAAQGVDAKSEVVLNPMTNAVRVVGEVMVKPFRIPLGDVWLEVKQDAPLRSVMAFWRARGIPPGDVLLLIQKLGEAKALPVPVRIAEASM